MAPLYTSFTKSKQLPNVHRKSLLTVNITAAYTAYHAHTHTQTHAIIEIYKQNQLHCTRIPCTHTHKCIFPHFGFHYTSNEKNNYKRCVFTSNSCICSKTTIPLSFLLECMHAWVCVCMCMYCFPIYRPKM